MSTTALALLDRRGSTSIFANPANIHATFSHKVEIRKRNIGKGKQDVIRNEFALTLPMMVQPCGDTTCSVEVFDSGRLTLSGNDQDHLKRIWADLKRNVDLILESTHVLNGMPIPVSGLALDITDAPVKPEV